MGKGTMKAKKLKEEFIAVWSKKFTLSTVESVLVSSVLHWVVQHYDLTPKKITH